MRSADSGTSDGRTPLLLVISAPSGAGKTTLCQGLLAGDARLRRAITCTTRAPRGQERHGVDYFFLSPDEFSAQLEAGAFLEHAMVFGNRYGTRRSEVVDRLQEGFDVVLNIDIQGAALVRAAARANPILAPSLVTIFIAPPSRAELARRLRARGEDGPAAVTRRLETAAVEMAAAGDFDYLLISENIPDDLRRAQAVVTAERLRASRQPVPLV